MTNSTPKTFESARDEAAIDDWLNRTDHYYNQIKEFHICATTQDAFSEGANFGYRFALESAEVKQMREAIRWLRLGKDWNEFDDGGIEIARKADSVAEAFDKLLERLKA